MTAHYRQCTMVSAAAKTVAWIEDHALRVGKKVMLTDSEDPDRHWTIEFVGEHRMPEKQARAHERAYLKHRAHSDI